jgi:hypothetical protein
MIDVDYNPSGSGDLDAVKSDGTAFARDPVTQLIAFTAGTFYVELGSDESPAAAMTSLLATHFAWSAAFAATITVETSNFPQGNVRRGNGPALVTSYDATAGNWIQENPSTGYVGTSGSGNTATGLTVTAGGSASGGCMYHLGNDGARRTRFKLIVTVGGTCRINRRAKNAA